MVSSVQGMCSCPLPVGLAAYMALDPTHQTHSSSSSGHETTLTKPSGTDPPIAPSHSPLPTPRAAPGSPAALATRQSGPGQLQASRSRQLGMHANAAWDAMPELAGCGPLLPSWRQVADLLVPLLHKVSSDLVGSGSSCRV